MRQRAPSVTWRLPALCGVLILSACAPKPTPQNSQQSPLHSTATPSTAIPDPGGVWSVHDNQGQPFNLILFPNGQAVSTWVKGPQGPRGERGFWREMDGILRVFFDDEWTDRLLVLEGTLTHQRFAPGNSLSGPPTISAPTERFAADAAAFVGVWRLNREPDGSYLYLALQSDGAAFSTINGLTEGRWEAVDKAAKISWPDGWKDVIERSAGSWQKRSWVGAEEGTLADVSQATRVGETRFSVEP